MKLIQMSPLKMDDEKKEKSSSTRITTNSQEDIQIRINDEIEDNDNDDNDKEQSPTPASGNGNRHNNNHNQTVAPNCFHRQVNIKTEFNLIRTLTKSQFGKVILAKKDDEKMVLKVFQAKSISWDEFQKEVHYNYFLSPHPNIVTSYNVSFEWKNSYIFVQEYAAFGDLEHFSKKFPTSIGEIQIKSIISQIASALDFMHGINLVHGDVILSNVLVFKQDLTSVKLCDFGSTKTIGTLMVRRVSLGNAVESTFPPEICDIIPQEKYYSSASSDVWQLGISLLTLLSGISPWNVADITDSNYLHYHDWLRRKSIRMPEPFKLCTTRLIRLLKRLLEPKPSKRCAVREVFKYMKDTWIEKQQLCLFRKSPSTSSVINNNNPATNTLTIGRHNSLAVCTPNVHRKESNASSSSIDNKKRRSISPNIAALAATDIPTTAGNSTSSIKIIIGSQPTTTTTSSETTGRHVRTKSLKTGREPCRRHTIRDISPASSSSVAKFRNNYTNTMRRCTSYELPLADTSSAIALSRSSSTRRKNS